MLKTRNEVFWAIALVAAAAVSIFLLIGFMPDVADVSTLGLVARSFWPLFTVIALMAFVLAMLSFSIGGTVRCVRTIVLLAILGLLIVAAIVVPAFLFRG
jgi:predicted cobalt transporter CbtA